MCESATAHGRSLPAFRLAHLSDLHLAAEVAPARLSDLPTKRTLSRLAWRRKRQLHDPAVLAALVDDVKAYDPDHVALSGDLTNFSTPEEFAYARGWLGDLGGPESVTVSLGNHDALIARGHAARLASLTPWLGDAGEPVFPQVRRRGPMALVNLCSALATPPLMATGRLGEAQIERLDQILAELAPSGLCRVVMLHHPVGAGVVSWRKSLTDAPALRAVLARRGADLVLHGHAHEAVFGAVAGPGEPIPCLCVPSASAGAPDGGRWHAVEIDPDAPRRGLRVTARAYDATSRRFVELGRYRLPAIATPIA